MEKPISDAAASKATAQRALIAFCRPGFEGESALELAALAAAHGVHGYARTERSSGLVEWIPTHWDALINPAQASPDSLPAAQGASTKTDWPSLEAAQRGAAGRLSGPNLLNSNEGVMSGRPPDRRARLDQTASLHCATRTNPPTFLTACRLRGVDQSIPSDGLDVLVRKLDWRDTVFCRQLLEGFAKASAMDRTDRLASLLPAIRASGMRYRDVRVEAPDSDACRELAALCRALNSALVAALKREQLLDPVAPQRLHIVLTAGDAALLARVDIGRGPLWPSGIPRLKFPSEAPSRSTLKLDEGLMVLLDDDERERWLKPGMTAVDLGAAPGGWTWQLVRRSMRVTAIDNGPMDSRLLDSGLVDHHRVDGFRYQPPKPVDWMVCDMVEQPRRVAARMAEWLAEGWCRMAMFNLKLPMKKRLDEVNLCREIFAERLAGKNLDWRARQLYHDREEVTVFARITGR